MPRREWDFQPRSPAVGEQLFRAGDVADEAFLLVEGEVELRDRNGGLVEVVTSPHVLIGGRAALAGGLHTSAATVTTASTVWALPAAALQRIQMIYPSILFHLRVVEQSGLPR